MRLPLDQIDPHALIRDRSVIDPEGLAELRLSIATNGLRQPVEVFATPKGYGLISGYRRLAAVRALFELTGDDRYAAIEARLLDPASPEAALAAMVEENDIRQALSPWEKARIAVAATQTEAFPNLDAALAGLYPHASRQKRAKLRALADTVEALDDLLVDPEALSENRLLRIANVLRLGWGELIEEAVTQGPQTREAQWARLAPVLAEAETLQTTGAPTRPDRPRRLARFRNGLTFRREKTRDGYLFHVTGRGATDRLTDELLAEIERMFSPE